MSHIRDDEIFMRRALHLAERGWGRVAPNPLVGAVVVRNGAIVGEGFHAAWGGPHAEVVALDAAGESGRGATLYVNLEPCHHRGKTGPCSERILQAGISRLVCASAEVNPEASGAGEWLQARGVKVEMGVCEQQAADLNAVHLNAFRRQRPFLALKYAITLDGRLSEKPGVATRVSGGEAIREAHRLRAGHDAILVGIETALVDDPLLTVREWKAPRVAPARVVVDSALRLPTTARLVRTAGDADVYVFASAEAEPSRAESLEIHGVNVLRVALCSEGEGLRLEDVLSGLWSRGVRSVLCEGGGTLGSALLAAGLVDRLYLFIAPRYFGEPGVLGFRGPRGRASRDWRVLQRSELGAVTLLALAAAEDVVA